MKGCWLCNDGPFPARPLCPIGVEGGIAFSSLRDRDDRPARDTLRDLFLFAAVFPVASWSPNENMTHPRLWMCFALRTGALAAHVATRLLVWREEQREKCPLEIAGLLNHGVSFDPLPPSAPAQLHISEPLAHSEQPPEQGQ